MMNSRILSRLGFFCILALACAVQPVLMAGQDVTNPKRHDGTWVYNNPTSGNVGYFTCTSINNSSSRAYTCAGSIYTPEGWTIPVYGDGFFTGKDTYRERSIAQFRVPDGGPLLFIVSTVSGRMKDDNTADFNQVATTYMDIDDDGVLGESDLLLVTSEEEPASVRRLISVFPDMEFPDYPEEP